MSGLVWMADDRDLIIGELREGVRSIKEHLRRQDDIALARDQQLEINKREAIKAREEKEARDDEKHAENTRKLDAVDRKLTTTFGLSSMNDQWITATGQPAVEWVEDQGRPLVNRVVALETIHADAVRQMNRDRDRRTGAAAVWAVIGGSLAALGTVIGFIGLDGIAAFLARMARAMGAD